MNELQEDIRQLRSVLAKDSMKYLEMGNNMESEKLKRRMEEVRKTLEVLNPGNSIELYDYKKNHEAFYAYIDDKERKHNVSIFRIDSIDYDHVEDERKRYGFSDKFIFGKVIVQLVEYYIKNNNLLERYVNHVLEEESTSFVHTMKGPTFSVEEIELIKSIEEKYVKSE